MGGGAMVRGLVVLLVLSVEESRHIGDNVLEVTSKEEARFGRSSGQCTRSSSSGYKQGPESGDAEQCRA